MGTALQVVQTTGLLPVIGMGGSWLKWLCMGACWDRLGIGLGARVAARHTCCRLVPFLMCRMRLARPCSYTAPL